MSAESRGAELALADPDVLSVLATFRSRYRRKLDPDDLESHLLEALWRALRSHGWGRQRFTNSLWRFCVWELTRAAGAEARRPKPRRLRPNTPAPAGSPDLVEHVRARMGRLLREERRAITMHYFENETAASCAEALSMSPARFSSLLARATRRLREECGRRVGK